jgi:hypothetical protein
MVGWSGWAGRCLWLHRPVVAIPWVCSSAFGSASAAVAHGLVLVTVNPAAPFDTRAQRGACVWSAHAATTTTSVRGLLLASFPQARHCLSEPPPSSLRSIRVTESTLPLRRSGQEAGVVLVLRR